ncbi:cobalt-precorrin-6A reductase [Aquibaculum sediminis]|uniref:cobalt-precorrin-6A reductase n=1 Tax=Aquibaculum sediminis TaxID=3231907 RepID=UPI0034550B8E
MRPNLLILAGTTEAAALARALSKRGLTATLSFAGRVARPLPQPLPQRIGGFGGPEGLAAWLQTHRITHVIDATHPFAVQMSRNAVAACAKVDVPLLGLTRSPWTPLPGDHWIHVPDLAAAVAKLNQPRSRVMLAVGRMHLAAFAPNPQHFYLLRLVDPPAANPPFPDAEVIVDRGPFDEAADRALMEQYGIELVVSKNSGGTGAHAKIAAARTLGLPVVMIDRPTPPARAEVHDVEGVLAWVAHARTDLGV